MNGDTGIVLGGNEAIGWPSAGVASASSYSTVDKDSGSGWEWAFWRRSSRDAAPAANAAESTTCQRSPKMARLEAVLMVAEGALSTRRLSHFAMLADASEASQLVEALNRAYDEVGCAFRVERVASGYQLLTRPEYAFWLDKLHQRQGELKLSPPAMETLSIVAYRQPIVRADIESIRGVQCAEMLKQLMDRGLVRIGGEDDSLGRPYLYETTRKFLEIFGLKDLNDLPMAERLRRGKPLTVAAEPVDEEPAANGADEDELAASERNANELTADDGNPPADESASESAGDAADDDESRLNDAA